MGTDAVFAIHNMTDNKINYRLSEKHLSTKIKNDFKMTDYLTFNEYNFNNLELEPFQVIWLGF